MIIALAALQVEDRSFYANYLTLTSLMIEFSEYCLTGVASISRDLADGVMPNSC
jgi:hypothetical protein